LPIAATTLTGQVRVLIFEVVYTIVLMRMLTPGTSVGQGKWAGADSFGPSEMIEVWLPGVKPKITAIPVFDTVSDTGQNILTVNLTTDA
jgi:ABC-type cobalt transport system substrate-binding protein